MRPTRAFRFRRDFAYASSRHRLVPLYGELPRDIVSGGAVTTSELLGEITTLIGFSSAAEPRHTKRLLFWKRIFTKLMDWQTSST